MIPAFDLFDVALTDEDVLKGDYVGHPFRGNQWMDANGVARGDAGSSPDQDKQAYDLRQQGKSWEEIAKILGYANGGSVRRLAMRHEKRLKDGGQEVVKPEPKPEPKVKPPKGREPENYDEAVALAKSLIKATFNGDAIATLTKLMADSGKTFDPNDEAYKLTDAERVMEEKVLMVGDAVRMALAFAQAQASGLDPKEAARVREEHDALKNAWQKLVDARAEAEKTALADARKALTGSKQGASWNPTFTVSSFADQIAAARALAERDGLLKPDESIQYIGGSVALGFAGAKASTELQTLVDQLKADEPTADVRTRGKDLFVPVDPRSTTASLVRAVYDANKDALQLIEALSSEVTAGRKTVAEVKQILSSPTAIVDQMNRTYVLPENKGERTDNDYRDTHAGWSGRQVSLLKPETRQEMLVAAVQKAAQSSNFVESIGAAMSRPIGDLVGVNIGKLDPTMTYRQVQERQIEINTKIREQNEKQEASGIARGTVVRRVLEDVGVKMASPDLLRVNFDPKRKDAAELTAAAREISMMLPRAFVLGSDSLKPQFSGGGHMTAELKFGGGRAHAQNQMGGKFIIKHETIPTNSARGLTSWKSVFLHETVHGMEYANPLIRYLEYLTWTRRGEGEPLRTLKSITGASGYQSYEKGKKDAWGNAYAGKEYGKSGTSTYEIMTTGMQSLYFGDERADREHLNAVLGILAAASTLAGNK